MGKCGRYSTLFAAALMALALFSPQRLSGTETLHLCRWDSILVVPEKGCNPPITVTLSGYSANYDGTPRLTVGNQSADGFSITYAYDHKGRMGEEEKPTCSANCFLMFMGYVPYVIDLLERSSGNLNIPPAITTPDMLIGNIEEFSKTCKRYKCGLLKVDEGTITW